MNISRGCPKQPFTFPRTSDADRWYGVAMLAVRLPLLFSSKATPSLVLPSIVELVIVVTRLPLHLRVR